MNRVRERGHSGPVRADEEPQSDRIDTPFLIAQLSFDQPR